MSWLEDMELHSPACALRVYGGLGPVVCNCSVSEIKKQNKKLTDMGDALYEQLLREKGLKDALSRIVHMTVNTPISNAQEVAYEALRKLEHNE